MARKHDPRLVPGTAEMVDTTLEKLDDVAKGDHDRLRRLLPLITYGDDGPTADRTACVERLFDLDDAKFRAFAARVNKHAAGLLEVRSAKASDGRAVIKFFVPDDAEQRIIGHSSASSDLPEGMVDNPAIPGDREGRRPLLFTVLHAAKDAKQATALIEALRTYLRGSKTFAHDLWDQSKILTGKDTKAETAAAFRRSDYVIVLLSPALASEDSLAAALELARQRPCVPVMFGLLPESHRLDAFMAMQPYNCNRGPWTQLTTAAQRETFNKGLFEAIERVAEGAHATEDAWCRHAREAAHLPEWTADNDAALTDLRDVAADTRRAAEPQSGLQMLLDWVGKSDGSRYACVLGEFGIGKTTLLKRFTHALLARREGDKRWPLPIFLDLKTYMGSIEGARKQQGAVSLPRLKEFLRELLSGTWKNPEAPPEPEQLLRMVREAGAVVIVDGLDEKLVHLGESEGAELIRMLWGLLPPALFRKPVHGKRLGRVVISCRSHVFPNLHKQNVSFTGGLRDDVRVEDYLALVVLPFNETKVREYLKHHVGVRVNEVLKLIASVHNLSDLAPRPLFLELIRKQIGRLEAMAARGEPVRGVSLYDHLVEACVVRDEGKHTIRPEDKPRFMEEIAAAMWRDGAREWPWEQVFEWLRRHIVGDPVLKEAYPLDREHTARIAEDFRAATMLLRPDQGNLFRFAHTSMQEYFLARWLYRGLVEQRPGDWTVPMPSDETLDFLGQLIVARGGERWRETLGQLLEVHRTMATRIAFRYWLLACERGHPQPAPVRVCLPGEDLDGWTIAGTDAAQLFLAGADLRGAKLRGASLRRVNLRGADVRDADMGCAILEDVDFHGHVAGANLEGSVWRDCQVEEIDGDASWWDSEWIRTSPPPSLQTVDVAWIPPSFARVEIRSGHGSTSPAWAYSPDGANIVSASGDNTLKIWDARSGRVLLSMEGHTDKIWACGYSPDGSTVLSASEDKTLKMWDARSGHAILTLAGHTDRVTACGYSPTGKNVVSASDDRSLKVWDAQSGRVVLTIPGHLDRVTACGFGPEGTRIVSVSGNKTPQVWDMNSGDEVVGLAGRCNAVRTCGYSPDGRNIVSASGGNTLRVWDAETGRSILTLTGHTAPVTACGYSPDGARIVSASQDRTVKVWEGRSGRVIVSLKGHTETVTVCGFSPDGTRIFSAAQDRTLKVWDAHSGRCTLTIRGYGTLLHPCGYSRDGASIVSGSGAALKVWDIRSGRLVLPHEGHVGERVHGQSPDGATIVSTSEEGMIKVLDAATGSLLRTHWCYGEIAATLDHVANRVLWATPNAWKYLCYRAFDPERNAYRVYPIEAFGPLPSD